MKQSAKSALAEASRIVAEAADSIVEIDWTADPKTDREREIALGSHSKDRDREYGPRYLQRSMRGLHGS